jgi:hypothetical protein
MEKNMYKIMTIQKFSWNIITILQEDVTLDGLKEDGTVN